MADLHPLGEGHPTPSKRSSVDVMASSMPTVPVAPILKRRVSYKGELAVSFTNEEVQLLASPFRFSLAGKFLKGQPSMEALSKDFVGVGFNGPFSLGLLDTRHVLIRFDLEEGYHRCWLHRFWSFQGFGMQVFKWIPFFSVEPESSIVPIWVRLPSLPIHLFGKRPLFSIVKLIGKPLKLDASISTLARPNVACICVEVDLLHDLPNRIWINNGSISFWQHVEYENVSDYCTCYRKLGHPSSECKAIQPT